MDITSHGALIALGNLFIGLLIGVKVGHYRGHVAGTRVGFRRGLHVARGVKHGA